MQKIKQILRKIKTWTSDRYHILFKSAAVNHLRIQDVLRNSDGSYQLSLRFASYSELKQYQKKLRKLTVSLSSAVAMMVVAFIMAPYIMNPSRSSAATFLWTQNSWVGSGTGAVKQYPVDNSGVTDYASKNNIDISSGKITLPTPQPSSAGDFTYAGFSVSGFYTADMNGNYSASGTNIAVKKEVDAKCSNGAECTSGFCSGTCPAPCSATTTCGKSCIYDNDMYSTVQIGTQCWFRENLRNTKYADGTSSSRYCYLGDSNCTNLSASGMKFGGLYSKGAMLHGAATVTLDAAKGPQGICPNGWHVPSNVEWDALIATAGATNLAAVATNKFSAVYAGYITNTGTNTGREGEASPISSFWSASNAVGGQTYYANLTLARYFLSAGTMTYGGTPTNFYESKFSVRCIRD